MAVVAAAWLLVITMAYLLASGSVVVVASERLAAQASQHWLMAGLVGIASGLVGLVWAGSRRQVWLGRLAVGAIVGVTTLLIGLILVAGRAAGAVAAVLWLLALGWAVGDRVLQFLLPAMMRQRLGAHRVLAIALGLGLLSHAMLGLALVGLLYQLLVLSLLIGLSLMLRRSLHELLLTGAAFAGRGLAALREPAAASLAGWFGLPLLALLAIMLSLAFVEAVAPETGFDAMSYHLALLTTYSEHHRLVSTPYNVQSWFYLGADMNYLLAMMIGGQTAAKLVHFSFMLLTGATVFAFTARRSSTYSGLLAAVLFVTAPLVLWEASTAYVDLALSYYSCLTISAVSCWVDNRHPGYLRVAGLLAGWAISIKLTALYLLIPLVAILAITLLSDRHQPWRHQLRAMLAFGGPLLITGAPWPVLRWVQTGNPVFPFFNDLFRSPLWPAGADLPVLTSYGIGTSAESLIRLPWAVTFQANLFSESSVPSVIGLSLVLVPLLVVGRPWPAWTLPLLGIVLVFGLLWVYTGWQYLRFLLPVLPIVAVLAGDALASLDRVMSPIIPRSALLIWLAASLPLTAALYGNVTTASIFRVALGLETPASFLSHAVPAYDAYRWLATHYADQPVHTLTIGDEARLYAPGIVEPIYSPTLWPRLREASDDETAMAILREHGITHLLIDRARPTAWLEIFRLTKPAFLASHAELEFANNTIFLYRLRARPPGT